MKILDVYTLDETHKHHADNPITIEVNRKYCSQIKAIKQWDGIRFIMSHRVMPSSACERCDKDTLRDTSTVLPWPHVLQTLVVRATIDLTLTFLLDINECRLFC